MMTFFGSFVSIGCLVNAYMVLSSDDYAYRINAALCCAAVFLDIIGDKILK